MSVFRLARIMNFGKPINAGPILLFTHYLPTVCRSITTVQAREADRSGCIWGGQSNGGRDYVQVKVLLTLDNAQTDPSDADLQGTTLS